MRKYNPVKWKQYKPQLDMKRNNDVVNGKCTQCENPIVPAKTKCALHEMQHRSYYLKKMYNITLAQYQELWEQCNGCCWSCGWQWVTGKRRLHVDHDHKSGLIRGLLCYTCNRGLGVFRDRSVVLRQAAAYLESNWSSQKWQVPGNYNTIRVKHRGVNKGVF